MALFFLFYFLKNSFSDKKNSQKIFQKQIAERQV